MIFFSADQFGTAEINLTDIENSDTTNKTASNVAERGFSLYLATYEHEIAAYKLGEGWLLVSRHTSSHLTCTQPFLMWNLFSAWWAEWFGGLSKLLLWKPCLLHMSVIYSWRDWLTASRMTDRKGIEWNMAFIFISFFFPQSLSLDLYGYFYISILVQAWTICIFFQIK